MRFFPSLEGSATIRAETRAFVAAFVQRIEAGLLRGAPHRRCHYVVTRQGMEGLRFRAADWRTALNVGLNDVELAVSSDGRVRYTIRYMRWAGYALALSGALGLVFMTVLLAFDMRGYIARHPESRFPGLSIDQNLAIAWAMALFWGFAWPWLLIAFHQRPLRRLMDQIIAEVDVAAAEQGRNAPRA